eukprot:1155891-Pelagomonas_calceolata.AAC.7
MHVRRSSPTRHVQSTLLDDSPCRRVYAFFHPCLPGEPLVILHCALVWGEPCKGLHQLLGLQQHAHIHDTAQGSSAPFASDAAQQPPSTAMFYRWALKMFCAKHQRDATWLGRDRFGKISDQASGRLCKGV